MNVKIIPNLEKENYFTVTPYGPIDSDTYIEFKERLQPIFAKKAKGVLIDLTNVDYISSAGLGVLFTIKKFLIANGGELLFCNMKPQIKKLFDIVKALPPQTLFNSVEEADRYFYKMMNEEIDKEKK